MAGYWVPKSTAILLSGKDVSRMQQELLQRFGAPRSDAAARGYPCGTGACWDADRKPTTTIRDQPDQ